MILVTSEIMVQEMSYDIETYKETVVFGLTAKQLFYSIASVSCGGAIVLLLYPHIGLTASAYAAIPVSAPIAVSGFYSFHGMSIFEIAIRRWRLIYYKKPLYYVSTESEESLNRLRREFEKEIKKEMKKGYERD